MRQAAGRVRVSVGTDDDDGNARPLAMTAYRCNQLKPVHMRQMEIGNDGGDLLVVILEQSKRIFRIRKENNVDTGNAAQGDFERRSGMLLILDNKHQPTHRLP